MGTLLGVKYTYVEIGSESAAVDMDTVELPEDMRDVLTETAQWQKMTAHMALLNKLTNLGPQEQQVAAALREFDAAAISATLETNS